MRESLGWEALATADQLLSWVSQSGEWSLVLLSIEDCSACVHLKDSLKIEQLATRIDRAALVVFKELNPDHLKAMLKLKAESFPQLRLYKTGKLRSAAEGCSQDLEPAAVHAQVAAWIDQVRAKTRPD